jgi:peptide/nickel transport system substrate-binding protein
MKNMKLTQGRRTRNRLLALVLVLLLVSVAGFTRGSKEETAGPAPEEKGEKGYGGKMVIGFTETMETLAIDVGNLWTNWGSLYNILVYDSMEHFNLPPDYYSLSPRIVQSYETSEDRKTWTIHIVKNAKWHDGEPLTAEDVKFSIEQLYARDDWVDVDFAVESVEIIDDYTLKVVNSRPITNTNPPGYWSWDPVIPKHIFEGYEDNVPEYPNEEAIGSGPFKLKEYREGEYMWMVANEDYWDGRPYLDEVVFRYYGNRETMLMALQKGDIDAFGNEQIPAHALEDIQADPNIKVEIVDGLALEWLSFNLHKETALQDKTVRQAILTAIDRDRIIDMVYLGYAEKYDSWVYTEDPLHHPNLPQFDYDPVKANSMLEEAGYRDTDGDGIRNDPKTGANLRFELLAPAEEDSRVKMATLVTEFLPEIGIAVDFKTVDLDTFYEFVYYPEEDAYEIALSGEEPAPAPYADWIWIEAVSWGAGGDEWNSSFYSNPHFDELTELLTSAAGMEERRAIIYEMQEIMADDLPYGFLVRPKWLSAYRVDKFEGWVNQIGGPVTWMNPHSILKARLK